MLGMAQAQKNRLDEAESSIQRAVELSSHDPLTLGIGGLGYVYAVSGRSAEAAAVIDRLKGLTKPAAIELPRQNPRIGKHERNEREQAQNETTARSI